MFHDDCDILVQFLMKRVEKRSVTLFTINVRESNEHFYVEYCSCIVFVSK